jgi:hypothetical protein
MLKQLILLSYFLLGAHYTHALSVGPCIEGGLFQS